MCGEVERRGRLGRDGWGRVNEGPVLARETWARARRVSFGRDRGEVQEKCEPMTGV